MNETVETYLKQVSRQLKSLPPQQRESELRESELRESENHLRTMIEARRADGDLESKAVDDALLQFGTAWHIGRDLTYAYQQRHSEHPLRAIAAGVGAVLCQYGFFALYQWCSLHWWIFWAPTVDPIPPKFVSYGSSLLDYALIATPVISSLLASWIAPRRGWWTALTFYAIVALVIAGIVEKPTSFEVFLYFTPGLLLGAWLGKRRAARAVERSMLVQ